MTHLCSLPLNWRCLWVWASGSVYRKLKLAVNISYQFVSWYFLSVGIVTRENICTSLETVALTFDYKGMNIEQNISRIAEYLFLFNLLCWSVSLYYMLLTSVNWSRQIIDVVDFKLVISSYIFTLHENRLGFQNKMVSLSFQISLYLWFHILTSTSRLRKLKPRISPVNSLEFPSKRDSQWYQTQVSVCLGTLSLVRGRKAQSLQTDVPFKCNSIFLFLTAQPL